jgi:hypothetical protein
VLSAVAVITDKAYQVSEAGRAGAGRSAVNPARDGDGGRCEEAGGRDRSQY